MVYDARVMTADELFAMPDDGHRYELVRGVVRMMSPAGGRHGRIALKLARRLGDFVETHRLGETFAAETGFLLRRDPDTVRAPDLAFVSRERLGAYADYPGYLPVVPDLVAEVVSPTDLASDVEEKVRDWLAAGVRMVLVADPQTRTVRQYCSAQQIRVYDRGTLDLGAVLVGCRLDVLDLFS
jgi:Uma2 family endonuclease